MHAVHEPITCVASCASLITATGSRCPANTLCADFSANFSLYSAGSTPSSAHPPTPSNTPNAPLCFNTKHASSPPLSALSGCGTKIAPALETSNLVAAARAAVPPLALLAPPRVVPTPPPPRPRDLQAFTRIARAVPASLARTRVAIARRSLDRVANPIASPIAPSRRARVARAASERVDRERAFFSTFRRARRRRARLRRRRTRRAVAPSVGRSVGRVAF